LARAAPDGYTLLSVSSAHAAAAAIYAKLPYETKDSPRHPDRQLQVRAGGRAFAQDELARAADRRGEGQPGTHQFLLGGGGQRHALRRRDLQVDGGIDVVHIPLKGSRRRSPKC